MSDVTPILSQIETGDPSLVEHLLPLVYDELRKLARTRMANERIDHTSTTTRSRVLPFTYLFGKVNKYSGATYASRIGARHPLGTRMPCPLKVLAEIVVCDAGCLA